MKDIYWLGLALVFCMACSKQNQSNLSTTVTESHLPKHLESTVFHWDANEDVPEQTAFQLIIASSKDKIKQGVGDVWDSGIKASSETSYKAYCTSQYSNNFWSVRTWHGSDSANAYRAPSQVSLPSPDESSRIVFLGGTTIAHMDDYPSLEMALSTHWNSPNVSFRNIGWPADDVFGMARSQFGSAQNTRSWQPPSAEEGYGSEVLQNHIRDAAPDLIFVSYGAETAWHTSEEEFEIFQRGYADVLDFIESLRCEVILLTPFAHLSNPNGPTALQNANQNLARTSKYILDISAKRGIDAIDLFTDFDEPDGYAQNGYQLNQEGHKLLADKILSSLQISIPKTPQLEMDGDGFPQSTDRVRITNWVRTVKGVRFDLLTEGPEWNFKFDNPNATKIDNRLFDAEEAYHQLVRDDSLRVHHLQHAIQTKNKYYRYRLRPLNEAYIFLFRRHEMGHLASELDQYSELIAEEELRIARLLDQEPLRIEIELDRSWKSPKDYPEDEVPANVPAPNIQEELAAFDLAPGLAINMYASDPMIMNPINVNWDLKGRAWVATSSTYPHILPGKEPNDKIIILEDTNNDGEADKHIVFAEDLLVPQSVMPVEGGAYVCSSTEFLFLADTNNDDRADVRHIIYDGFGNADVHHMIHGLRWAPWGDLYFTQSIYINSFIETAFGPRVLNGSGTWQFRPETERLEIFSRGMINPWGHAFDRYGQSFATDGAGSSGITYTYPGSAHMTAVGAERVLPALNSGTPKNTGAEVISSRHLPTSWQGSIVSSDFRRNRTVRYALEKSGSSYTSEEVQTIAHSDHRSFRPVDMKIGPDGALYLVDWYNPIIDHGEVDFHHPVRDHTHGRIWRITANNSRLLPVIDFTKLGENRLFDLLKSPEQLTRLQANRALVRKKVTPARIESWIKTQRSGNTHDHHALEGLWLSIALNAPNTTALSRCLNSSVPMIRAAAIRMLDHFPDLNRLDLLKVGVEDNDAQVRLEAVNALRRIGSIESVTLASSVLRDSLDTDLDFMLWSTFSETDQTWLPALTNDRSILEEDPRRVLFALQASSDEAASQLLSDLVRDGFFEGDLRTDALLHLAKKGGPDALSMVLNEAVNTKDTDLLSALSTSSGQPSLVQDASRLHALLEEEDSQLQSSAAKLIGSWKIDTDPEALLQALTDSDTKSSTQLQLAKALAALGKEDDLASVAQSDHPSELRAISASEWAKLAPADASGLVVDLLAELEDREQLRLLYRSYLGNEEGPAILASSLAGHNIPEGNAIAGLQLCRAAGRDFSQLISALEEAGSVQPVGAAMTEAEKESLLQEVVEKGDPGRGKQIYRYPQLQCGSCHYLGGIGGKLGPDLTTVGSYMTPGSILESLLNPGKDIKQGYETVLVTKTDGSVVGGILDRKTGTATLLRDATNEIKSIPNAEIESIDVSPMSLMPAGLTASLRRDEMVDLLAFLTNLGKEDMGTWIH